MCIKCRRTWGSGHNSCYSCSSNVPRFHLCKLIHPLNFFAAFVKSRKATISFVMSVRMDHLGSRWKDFHEVWYLSIFFENLYRKFKFYLNPTRITGTLHKDQHTFMIISRSVLLRMKRFHIKVVEKNKTHISYSVTFFFFFPKIVPFWDNVEKYCRARQATYNTAHALCMLEYKYTFQNM